MVNKMRRFMSKTKASLEMFRSPNFRFLKFSPPGHFYSPIPDLLDLNTRRRVIFDKSVTEIPGIELNVEDQLSLLNTFSDYYPQFPFQERKTPDLRFYLDNSYFTYGDSLALYGFIRYQKPRTIIEIGSGYSSAEMLDLNDLLFKNAIEFVFIEPYPVRLRGLLRSVDKEGCEILDQPIQAVPLNLFTKLNEGDILFIDSSHISKTGSDVNHILSNILPSLKKGVVIHFHDILWPFEYPEIWVDEGRAWNEAYLLRAFLQYNQAFKILLFNSFIETHHSEQLERQFPISMRKPSNRLTCGNTSLWLRKMT